MDKLVETEFVASDYGKNWVKILVVKKDTEKHEIRELEVCTALTLNNHRDYMLEDNSDVIATDSQKNTVHILAKQFGIKNIETFALLLSSHFLRKYQQVVATKINVIEYPWKRMDINGEKHNHAFQFIQDCTRVCEVTQKRNGGPLVKADDEYRTLPFVDDRIFSTIVTADWWYNTSTGFCFDKAWEEMKKCILEEFAGLATTGKFSASVQNTLYGAVKTALARIPQFGGCSNNVYMAVDKPSGNIHCVLQRAKTSKL
ncbi:hypothetical protein ACF0H5_023031 [Mactra antiquata]